MALDSRDKRASLISLALPFARVLPNPVGATWERPDRQHFAFLYRDPLIPPDMFLIGRSYRTRNYTGCSDRTRGLLGRSYRDRSFAGISDDTMELSGRSDRVRTFTGVYE